MPMMEIIPDKYKPKIWKSLDEAYPNNKNLKQTGRKRRKVNVNKIVGTIGRTNKWYPERFFHAVWLLKNGKYDYDYIRLPILFKINGEYFVVTDGNHRVLAFKYLKIKKMTADIVELY